MNLAHLARLTHFCLAAAGCESLTELDALMCAPGHESYGRHHHEVFRQERARILAGRHESDTGEVLEDLPDGY